MRRRVKRSLLYPLRTTCVYERVRGWYLLGALDYSAESQSSFLPLFVRRYRGSGGLLTAAVCGAHVL